ncbi:hypothetical protein AX769_20090 [Frondihabitans sp. PAMC 28766]|uniref:lipopolysaccharide biosynthesis protein n=1 Tax=Frondihabitans sp. PAMC 28766 TaxID=1795630 RepID=UPI00078BD2E1|nr:oligosaccharide flippase family protein [Frondihabitans sp. PAMC 28766]AMM22027.1 hypothetical protein AX769_20090 [Frondihabitans sp. PAMC 28766]
MSAPETAEMSQAAPVSGAARTGEQSPAEQAAEHGTEQTTEPTNSGLFGRGLLYVVVWSLQLLGSTIVSPILAHLLGPTQFGSLATAIALYQVLSVVALLGLDQALVLQRAEDGDARDSRGLVAVAVVISFLVTALALLTSPIWGGALGFTAEPKLVILVILWTGPSAAVQVMLSLLIAEDRLRTFSIVSVLSAVGGSFVGLILLVTIPGSDAITYAWGGVVCQFLAMFVGFAVTKPRIRGLWQWKVTGRAITLGIPLALGSLAYFVLNAGDRVIVQRDLGATEVGRYQVAYVVGSAVILLLNFTNSAWTPQFARLRSEVARYALAMRSRDELYRLLMPITLAVTLVSPLALRILAPASFKPNDLTLVVFIVALTAFPVAASGATDRLLIVQRRGKTLGALAGVAAVVNIAVNLVLVPIMGITGAALATLVAYSVLAILQLRALRGWRRGSTGRRAATKPPWRGPSATITLMIFASVLVAGASILLPQTLAWNLGRTAAALACLPWFLVRLRSARSAGDATESTSISDDSDGAPETPADVHTTGGTPA